MKKPIRVYTDTSVFGGVFDTEFALHSETFFGRARSGDFEIAVSALVEEEIEGAPDHVQRFFDDLLPTMIRTEVSVDAYALRRAYLEANVVSARWTADALHVAAATVSGCSAIASWNFKHIVNFQRIPLYNGVNQVEGYPPIAIHTPAEFIKDEED